MKKTLLFLAVFAASTMAVQAASIKWAIGGELDTGIDSSVGSFVLAYIGTTSGVGVDAATFSTEMAKGTDSAYSIVQNATWNDFYSSRANTYSKAKTYTTPSDVAGATYQAFYVQDGKYFLVNDPTITTMAVAIDAVGAVSATAYVDGQSTGSATMYAAGGSTTKITSVPEPSVALMGLLGLGMLLKRRKA